MKGSLPSPWLGDSRGYLSDWITQRWVKVTGTRVDTGIDTWLAGPIGETSGIGSDFFNRLAASENLEIVIDPGPKGLISDFSELSGKSFSANAVDDGVRDFYEQTSKYELDVWAEWSGAFRPFGWLLAWIFSKRLQQLNLPLSSLDTSRGMTSEILQLVEPATGQVRHTAWLRHLLGTGNVLYAGCYSLERVPGFDGMCVKVVFPLPNGNAIVLMRPEVGAGGSLIVHSAGKKFGDPGFYFTVRETSGMIKARYVRAMRESIHVYSAERSGSRADHVLKLFGITFLRLHYRMMEKQDLVNLSRKS